MTLRNGIVLLLMAGLVACSSTQTIKVGGQDKVVPKWVLNADDVDEPAGVTYGVGSARVDNVDIARYQADQSAIRHLLIKLDQRHHDKGTEKLSAQDGIGHRELTVISEFESKGITQGIRIVKRHVTDDGTWYSLAMLNVNLPDAGYESELKAPVVPPQATAQ